MKSANSTRNFFLTKPGYWITTILLFGLAIWIFSIILKCYIEWYVVKEFGTELIALIDVDDLKTSFVSEKMSKSIGYFIAEGIALIINNIVICIKFDNDDIKWYHYLLALLNIIEFYGIIRIAFAIICWVGVVAAIVIGIIVVVLMIHSGGAIFFL